MTRTQSSTPSLLLSLTLPLSRPSSPLYFRSNQNDFYLFNDIKALLLLTGCFSSAQCHPLSAPRCKPRPTPHRRSTDKERGSQTAFRTLNLPSLPLHHSPDRSPPRYPTAPTLSTKPPLPLPVASLRLTQRGTAAPRSSASDARRLIPPPISSPGRLDIVATTTLRGGALDPSPVR